MRKTSFALAAAAMVATSVPALADVGIDVRIVDLQRQVDAGKRSGKLSLGERVRLTNEIRATKRTVERYENSGGRFTRPEKRLVQNQLDRIQLRISTWKRNAVRGPNDVPF
jgi:hypothetical protein